MSCERLQDHWSSGYLQVHIWGYSVLKYSLENRDCHTLMSSAGEKLCKLAEKSIKLNPPAAFKTLYRERILYKMIERNRLN